MQKNNTLLNELINKNKDLPVTPLISKQFDEAAHAFDYSYVRLAGEVTNAFISEYSVYNGILILKEQVEDFKEYLIINDMQYKADDIIKNLVWKKAIIMYVETLVQESKYICLPEI